MARPSVPPLAAVQRQQRIIRGRLHVGTVGALARQVLLIVLAALAYFGVRGLTQGNLPTALAHAADILDVERALRIAWEAAWQDAIMGHGWLVTSANWVYIYGHWPVVVAVLGWLFVRHPEAYYELRDGMFISGAIGLIVFATFPTAPPRLADLGLLDTVTDRSSSYRTLQPPGLINKYAAMPSLHFGWNLIVGLMVWRVARHAAVRALALVLPVAMAWAVVVTANHFILDVIAGGIVATAGLLLAPAAGRMVARSRRARDLKRAQCG